MDTAIGADAGTLYCDDPTTADAAFSTDNTDCDDTQSGVNPGADEICDEANVDENCNSLADDEDTTTLNASKTKYYPDADMDSYGAVGRATLYCDDPSTATDMWSLDNTDCDDTTASVNPAQTEVCDDKNVDEDCNGDADDDDAGVDTSTQTTYYIDADKDSYGNSSDSGTTVCDDPSTSTTAYVTDNTDCDDREATTYPGATETTGDEVDSDCDGGEVCYVDKDDDGYRTDTTVTLADADCDDTGEAVQRLCPAKTVMTTTKPSIRCSWTLLPTALIKTVMVAKCYADGDGDGYRTDTTLTSADADCSDAGEALASAPSGDCDDRSASVNPGASEVVADNIDQNCDGREICYTDTDRDGYRTTTTITSTDSDCRDAGEAAASIPSGDCNDGNADINPGEREICDGLDNDCDSTTSEDGTAIVRVLYRDHYSVYGNHDYQCLRQCCVTMVLRP